VRSLLTKKIWRNYPPFLHIPKRNSSTWDEINELSWDDVNHISWDELLNPQLTELYTITESLRQAIEEAGLDTETGKKMMYLTSAEGKWVDHWGSYFGVSRLANEDDDHYKQRIIGEVIRPKQTVEGIIDCIATYTGLDKNQIIVFEPFIKLHPLDFGATTDETYLAGWNYWTWAVIDIQIPIQIDEGLTRIINELTKAYGVKVFINTQSNIYITYSQFDITEEAHSLSEIDFNQIKVSYITDFFGYTDGRMLSKDITESLWEYLLSYVVAVWGEYGFGDGEFGDIPFGGRSIIFESILNEG